MLKTRFALQRENKLKFHLKNFPQNIFINIIKQPGCDEHLSE